MKFYATYSNNQYFKTRNITKIHTGLVLCDFKVHASDNDRYIEELLTGNISEISIPKVLIN